MNGKLSYTCSRQVRQNNTSCKITNNYTQFTNNVFYLCSVQSVTQCVQSLSSRKVIHSSSPSCKRTAVRKNRDVDELLVGGVLPTLEVVVGSDWLAVGRPRGLTVTSQVVFT